MIVILGLATASATQVGSAVVKPMHKPKINFMTLSLSVYPISMVLRQTSSLPCPRPPIHPFLHVPYAPCPHHPLA